MSEPAASVEVPTDGDSEGTLLGKPTTEGDKEGELGIQEKTEIVGAIGTLTDQGLSRVDEPDKAADARADAPIDTEATDESPSTGTTLESCRTRQEARVDAQMWRKKGRTVRVVRASGDEADSERPWHVVDVP
jgi:hypothetical protein